MDYRDTIIEQLNKQLEIITEHDERQAVMIQSLTETIAGLQETIKDLQRQLNQNSQNSSKPPSSDGYKKPNPKSQRRKSGRKQGGQNGHPGSHMSIPHDPDEVKQHLPEKCMTCKHLTECLSNGKVFECGEKRYVVDAIITTKVTEHRSMRACSCMLGENGLSGSFPEGVKAYVQYGDSVSVLVGILNTYGAVSAMRIHVIVGSLLGVSLSTGTITSMVSRCASKVGPALRKIKELLCNGSLAHFDETGARNNGKLFWVHSSSTDKLTYQTINEKRGKPGMDDNGVLPGFHGTAVHDRWSPYWKYDGMSHATCNVHLLRDLTGVEENNPEHKWATKLKSLLLEMDRQKERAIDEGRDSLRPWELRQYSFMYDYIMSMAESECPAPDIPPRKKKGRKKKGKERSLIEALKKLKASVCLFIHDFNVPFGNNQAEQDVRNLKARLKVAGCFRTKKGAQDYLDITSYLSTGRKHGINAFDALTSALSGNTDIIFA